MTEDRVIDRGDLSEIPVDRVASTLAICLSTRQLAGVPCQEGMTEEEDAITFYISYLVFNNIHSI